MWEDAADLQGPAAGTKEGVAEEDRWIRDKFAVPRRVCMRSKR